MISDEFGIKISWMIEAAGDLRDVLERDVIVHIDGSIISLRYKY